MYKLIFGDGLSEIRFDEKSIAPNGWRLTKKGAQIPWYRFRVRCDFNKWISKLELAVKEEVYKDA